MSGRIPTSTSVSESAVIEAPFSDVWHLIKLQDFSKFWSALDKSEFVKGTSDEADVVKWAFKDGTVVEVKQEEHSVHSTALHLYTRAYQTLRASTTSSHTASSPPSLSCRTRPSFRPSAHTPLPQARTKARPSSPGLATSRAMPTLVCCTTIFDVMTIDWHPAGVIQDAKFKRREALADLAKAASKK
jgi:hypothetical protein